MDALQLAGIGKFAQVTANGLERHTKLPRKVLDRDLPVAPRDLENLQVSEYLRHNRCPLCAELWKIVADNKSSGVGSFRFFSFIGNYK